MKKKILLIFLGVIVLVAIFIYIDIKSREMIVHSLGDKVSEGSVEMVINNANYNYFEKTYIIPGFKTLNIPEETRKESYNCVLLNVTIKNKNSKNILHISDKNFSIITETDSSKYPFTSDFFNNSTFKSDNNYLLDTHNIFPNTEINGILVFQTTTKVDKVRLMFYPLASDNTGFRGAIYDLVLSK